MYHVAVFIDDLQALPSSLSFHGRRPCRLRSASGRPTGRAHGRRAAASGREPRAPPMTDQRQLPRAPRPPGGYRVVCALGAVTAHFPHVLSTVKGRLGPGTCRGLSTLHFRACVSQSAAQMLGLSKPGAACAAVTSIRCSPWSHAVHGRIATGLWTSGRATTGAATPTDGANMRGEAVPERTAFFTSFQSGSSLRWCYTYSGDINQLKQASHVGHGGACEAS